MVGPFVGVVSEGRIEAVGELFLSGLSTLSFRLAWVDSGALERSRSRFQMTSYSRHSPLALPGDFDGGVRAICSTTAFNDCGGDREGTKSR
jgi:hypothetical protein